jgi:hypothetical protein
MDETRCQDFFRRPSHTLQRRYEALRAVFLDHRPLAEIADAFGYDYGTLRNLLTGFRAQCRHGQVPPFSPTRNAAAPAAMAPRRVPRNPKSPLSPTAATSP